MPEPETVTWRRRPDPRPCRDQLAVRFNARQNVIPLVELMREADPKACIAVAQLADGPVAVISWERISDHGVQREHLVIRDGYWLAYDPDEGYLYESSDGNWEQFYDRA
jgi:hypothetical protein